MFSGLYENDEYLKRRSARIAKTISNTEMVGINRTTNKADRLSILREQSSRARLWYQYYFISSVTVRWYFLTWQNIEDERFKIGTIFYMQFDNAFIVVFFKGQKSTDAYE